MLKKMREMYVDGESIDIPSLKRRDRRKVMKEVTLVNGLIGNLVGDNMTITDINRLLYVRSYIVCDRLGLKRKARTEM